MEESEYFKSEEFREQARKGINKNTWDKDLPKYYIDKEGRIVEHFKNGVINIIKEKNERGTF